MAATVALVLFSVFIGVYGPRLGNRQQMPGGTTLIELAGAVEPRHAQRVFQARALADSPPLQPGEVGERISAAIGRPLQAPSPPDFELRWLSIDDVRLPGASGVLAFCSAEPRTDSSVGRDAFATVIVLRDEDRFTVFDRHGRPTPMPEGEVFSVALRAIGEGATLAAFRTGDLIFAVQTSSPDLSAELVAALETGAVAALRAPGAPWSGSEVR